MIAQQHFLSLSLLLFVLGIIGLSTRRDAITVFLSVEMMLNAANLAFVGFARALGQEVGHVAVFTLITVAAVEAAIGLSLVIQLKKHHGTLELSKLKSLRG